MNKWIISICLVVIILSSCSSGKQALQKGDYYSAVSKAIERLKSSPDNSKASTVLKEGYQYALNWSQEEIDLALASNSPFKWEHIIETMNQMNRLSGEIRSTPAARKLIAAPKTYTTELTSAYENAAEERYAAGQSELDFNTRETARIAYEHFTAADQYVPGYKNVRALMEMAREIATIRVVLETIPVHSQKFKLSSEFFYNQILGFLNKNYGSNGLVAVYSAYQAENEGIDVPDYIVNLEFFDFSIGNLTHTEKEEELKKKVIVESKDTTRVQYRNYSAKLKVFTDKVLSDGSLRMQIYQPATDKLFLDEILPGSFSWINEYAIFAGEIEALDKKQVDLTKRKVLQLPAEQDLFIEFTKPLYSQTVSRLSLIHI